jgi:phosphatidylglycerophosphate synthase
VTAPAAAPRPREIWTRLTVDPLAEPLALVLARRSWVTPNRVTGLAMCFAVGSAVCFATGLPRLGGALFLARFFTDCLDGKVARAQGTSSALGAMLDLVADVAGIAVVAAALCWSLLDSGEVAAVVPVAFMANLVYYNWALVYRKQLAHGLGVGDGGADHSRSVTLPLVGRWVALCRRLNMSPVPWVLEAEITVFGLAPLLLTSAWVGHVMALGAAFYTVANLVNTRRLWRLTQAIDLAGRPRTETT